MCYCQILASYAIYSLTFETIKRRSFADDFVDLHMSEDLYNIAKKNLLDFVKADFYRFMLDEFGNIIPMFNPVAKNSENYNKILKPSEAVWGFLKWLKGVLQRFSKSLIKTHRPMLHPIASVFLVKKCLKYI